MCDSTYKNKINTIMFTFEISHFGFISHLKDL